MSTNNNITYQKLPNELKEEIFLKSIETLQDLQQKCKVNRQYKLYCDRHFTSRITPIMEAIRDVINTTHNPTFNPHMHSIEIYTNQERNLITTTFNEDGTPDHLDTKIYTKLGHKRVLFDILNHNQTKDKFYYTILNTTPFQELVVYSINQSGIPTFARDYIKIKIN
jgi:hypothetical protein